MHTFLKTFKLLNIVNNNLVEIQKYITDITSMKSEWINEDSAFTSACFWLLLQTDDKNQVPLLTVHSLDWAMKENILVKRQKCLSSYFSWSIPHNLIKVDKGLKSVQDNCSEWPTSRAFKGDWGRTNTGYHRTCPTHILTCTRVSSVKMCSPRTL